MYLGQNASLVDENLRGQTRPGSVLFAEVLRGHLGAAMSKQPQKRPTDGELTHVRRNDYFVDLLQAVAVSDLRDQSLSPIPASTEVRS